MSLLFCREAAYLNTAFESRALRRGAQLVVELDMKITPEIAAVLKSYVYVYTDPHDGNPFYVGKGRGNRLFAHLDDTDETEKTNRIRDIRKSGQEPQIDIRYGLTDAEASLIEGSAIDLIGLSHLTNRVAGHHEKSFGRIGLPEVIAMLRSKPAEVRHKAILITINTLYRGNMTDGELYEATRGIWVVGPKRVHADYAMAVYQGIVGEVYQIQKRRPSGTRKYNTRDSKDVTAAGRWEFEGFIASDIRHEYVGNAVGMGGQYPIRYINVQCDERVSIGYAARFNDALRALRLSLRRHRS